ncbi:MAG: hypothetical protein U9R24_06260, partial [Thermodesulfobacteriota bacterium]|nr:hypothetical protein [Thermodesulfobacteriota bacterium]
MIQDTTVITRQLNGVFIRKLRKGVREKLGYRVRGKVMPEETGNVLDDAVTAIEKCAVFSVVYRVLPVEKID